MTPDSATSMLHASNPQGYPQISKHIFALFQFLKESKINMITKIKAGQIKPYLNISLFI